MGDIGGTAQAAASVTDTALTDTVNMYEAEQNRNFDKEQAGAQRDWSAQQAALNRQFQAGQQVQAENYNTQMSDTAMTRRVADLKNAGLNPLMAAGSLGGASTPIMSGMPGSVAGGGAAASMNSLPQISGIWDKLQQSKVASAQAANLNQNTAKQKVETGIGQDQLAQWDAITTPELLLKQQQQLAASYDLEYAKAKEVQSAVNIIRNASAQSDLNKTWQSLQNVMQGMSNEAQKATLTEFINMRSAMYQQQTTEARNVNDVQKGLLGKGIAYAQAVATPVATAAQGANSAASAASTLMKMVP